MSNRITQKILQTQIDVLNRTAGTPMEPYGENGGNTGNYHADYSNGGVSICRMGEPTRFGQGTDTIIPRGTMRETYDRLVSYIDGMRDGMDK